MASPASQQVIDLELDPDIRERVQRLANARSLSADRVVAEAVGQYVAREERREQFRVETQAAWDDYRTTGLHATAEEADAWLARLEAGEDANVPMCHR